MHRKFSSFNLLPNVIQSSINEVLCKNVFDPFLNEKEENYVFGAMSNNPQDVDKINIDDSYYHLNQIQPIFNVNESHYSFKDLLVELDKQGANLSTFKEWGDSSFLNFLPPINLDKFNNFQNYVWVDLDTSPSYVCIRSQLIHQQEHMLMVARKMAKAPLNIVSNTANSIDFEGDCSFIFNINPTVSIVDSINNNGNYNVNPSLTTVSYNNITNVHVTTVYLTTSTLNPSLNNGKIIIPNVSGNILASLFNVLRRVYNVTYFDTFAFDYDDPMIDGTDGLYYDQEGAIVENPEDLYVLNDWQLNNKWIHKDDVPINMHGIPATQPIIEYQYNLEMNQWFKVTRQWKYRATEYDDWIDTLEHRPSVHEFNLSRSVAHYEGLYESYLSFDISNITLYVSTSISVNINDLLNIKGNSNIYEVESVTVLSGQKALKLRTPSTPLLITLPNPSSSVTDPSDKRFRRIGKNSSVSNCNEIMVHDSSSNCLYTMGDLLQRSSWAYFGSTSSPITIISATTNSITINGNYPALHGNGSSPTITISGSAAGLNGTYIIDNSTTIVQQVGDSYTTTFIVTGMTTPTNTSYGMVAFNYITNNIMQVYDSLNNENVSLKILDIETTSTVSTDVLTNQTPSRPITKIIYDPLYNNPSSQICGNFISFNYTSQGDKWMGPFMHWVYDGVVDLTYAANRAERPLDSFYTHTESFSPNQEASIVSTYGSSNSNLRFAKNGLNTKVFINNRLQKAGYIEGYFNGTTFNLNPSNGLCNAIKFDSPVSREDGMTITLDLSVESWSDSHVHTFGLFRTNTSNDSIRKFVSGVSYYKNYQQQYSGNEYPVFNLYDRTNQFITANELFKYDDNGNSFSNELNDFVYKINNKEYRFENLMVDDNGVVLYYNNTNITKPVSGISRNYASSVWRRTSYPAYYIPKIKDRDGNVDATLDSTNFWEIPPYVTNNPKNNTEALASNSDLYPHFKRIIDHNSEDDFTYRGGYDTIDSNDDADRTYGETRYDVIGTITTSSIVAMLCANVALNNINFVNVMEFITRQQKLFIDANVNMILSKITENLSNNVVPSAITSYLDYIKQQHALNDLNVVMFGDSLSKRSNGIPNVCPTAAFAGLLNKRIPEVSYDHKRKIIRLQTHISQQYINVETECDLSDRIVTKIISDLGAYRNYPSVPNINDFWVDSSSQTIKQWNGSSWNDIISFNVIREIIGNNLVECEQALYDSCNAPLTNTLPAVTNAQTADYNNTIKKQFTKYVEHLNISDVTINPIFSETDPFTWNYMDVNYLNIINPLATPINSSHVGCDYRFLYERLFKTCYPHLEPWRMQGYTYKPSWWDSEYKWIIADGLPVRRWKPLMWSNILSGVVPSGYKLSDLVTISSGIAGQSTVYNFVSVNISSLVTSDGFEPDDLLPPYWVAPTASIADTTVQNYILIRNSAHINFSTISNSGEYGRGSYLERNWYDSVDFTNDVRVIARYLMQPFKYISEVLFNPDYLSGKFFSKNGQLESSNVCTLFTNNIQYDASSLFTYYARSKGILGINSNAGEQWASSDVKYGHINDKLINEVEVANFQSSPIQQITIVDNTRLVKRIDFTNFTISVVNQTRTSSRDQFKSRWKFLVNTNTNKVKSIDVKKTFFSPITKLNSNNTFNANLTDFATGMTVTFAADGVMSDDLSFQDIFYLIKISNSQGAIARTHSDCIADVRVAIDDRPSCTHYIMIPNSMQPVNGIVIPKTQNISKEITFPATIIGEYSLINFLVGYIEQQHENGINEANTKFGVMDSTDVDWWSQINLLRDVLQKLNDFSFNGGEFIDASNMVLNPYETEIRINHGDQYIIDNFVNQNGEYEDDSQLYDVFGRSITSNDIMVLRGKQVSTIRSINGRQIGGGSINILQKHSILMLPEDYYNFSFGLLLPRIDEVQMRISSSYNDRPGYVYLDGNLTKNLSTTISTHNNNLRNGTYNHYFNNMTDIDNISYSTFENNRIYETSLITKGTSQMFTSIFNGTVDEIIAFNMDGIINNDSNNIPLELTINNSINSKTITTISHTLTNVDIKLDFSDSRQWPLLPHYEDMIDRWTRSPKLNTILESSTITTNKLSVLHQLDEFYAGYVVEITQHNRANWLYETVFPINSNSLVEIFVGKITSHKKQCSVMLNDSVVDFSITYDSNGATIHVTLDDTAKTNTVKVLILSTLFLPGSMVSQLGYDDLNINESDLLPYDIDVSFKISGLYYQMDGDKLSMVYDTDAEEMLESLPTKKELAEKYMFSSIDPSTNNWKQLQVGKVWAKDISFKNWYNSTLYANHEQQIKDANVIDVSKNWGIYRWVESSIPPEQWYDIHDARTLGLLTSETENTKSFIGEPYNKLYFRNRSTNTDPWSVWTLYENIVADFYSQDAVIQYPTTLVPGTLINVFINGSFVSVVAVDEFNNVEFNNVLSNGRNKITLRESSPSFDNTDLLEFKREFIYNTGETVIDGVVFVKYYFWVKNHVDAISDVTQTFDNDIKPNSITYTCLGYDVLTDSFDEMVLHNTTQRTGLLKITKNVEHTWDTVKKSNTIRVPFYLWNLISNITKNPISSYTLHDELISSNTRYGLKVGQMLCDFEDLTNIILDSITLELDWGELTVNDIIDSIHNGTVSTLIANNYNTIPTSTINSIFFTLLFLCLSKTNFEYNVLVTSLVDVTTQVKIT